MVKDYTDHYYYRSAWQYWYKTFNKGIYVLDDFGNLIKVEETK